MNSSTWRWFFVRLFLERPRLGVIFFGAFALLTGFGMLKFGIDAPRFFKPPQVLTFEEAASQVSNGKLYVSLADMNWNCSETAKLNPSLDYTTIPLVDSSGERLVVYDSDLKIPCAEAQKAPATGVLQRFPDDRYKWLHDFAPIRSFKKENVYLLCGYGDSIPKIGFLMASAFFLFFLGMAIFCGKRVSFSPRKRSP